jgi:hypothetical protein
MWMGIGENLIHISRAYYTWKCAFWLCPYLIRGRYAFFIVSYSLGNCDDERHPKVTEINKVHSASNINNEIQIMPNRIYFSGRAIVRRACHRNTYVAMVRQLLNTLEESKREMESSMTSDNRELNPAMAFSFTHIDGSIGCLTVEDFD